MIEPGLAKTAEARWQNARIVDIVQRTPRIKSFFFELPEPFDYRAGQHVDLRLTAPDGYQAMRSYSIASAPHGSGRLEVAIDRLDDGEVSGFFHDVALVGDEIELHGPLGGHFVWEPSDGGPLLLIGGGSGVVPLMAMIRQRRGQGSTAPALLLLATRSLEEALYLDELLAAEAADDGFILRLALSRDRPLRSVDYGRRLDAAMVREAFALLGAPRHVFICGSNGFVDAAADSVVAAGTPPVRVRTERYGG